MKRLLLFLFFTCCAVLWAGAQTYTLPPSCSGAGTGNWQSLGPFDSYYGGSYENQGRIISLWVDPTDDNHILAGANCGGLWKTTDNGHNWSCLSDGTSGTNSILGMEGVTWIAVNPADHNTIYCSLQSDGDQNKKGGTYSLGLVYTTNGGAKWQIDNSFISAVGSFANAQSVTKVAYCPTSSELFAISQGKVLYKATPTSSWTDITPAGSSGIWWQDMQFSHVTSGVVYISANATGGACHIYKYSAGGGWSNVAMASATVGTTTYTFDNIPQFTLTASDDAIMRVSAHSGSTNYNMLIKSPTSTFSPTVVNTAFWSTITQFAVSQSNANIIYASNYFTFGSSYPATVLQSTDGGATFAVYGGPGHPDGRCIVIYSSTNTSNGLYDEVFVGNDGGVREKRSGNNYFESITGNNLAISQFYGLGNTEADDDYIAGGTQDDGGYAYNKHSPAPWANVDGGDGYTAKFMGKDSKNAIGEDNGATTISGPPWALYGMSFNPSFVSTFSVPAPADAVTSNINRPQSSDRNDNVFIGYSHIWKLAPGAGSWVRAFASDPMDVYSIGTPVVVDFYIDDANQNVAYISYRNVGGSSGYSYKLYYSSNAMAASPTWTDITPTPAGPSYNFIINSIAVDPKNNARVFVAFGSLYTAMLGTDPASMTNRVWYSTNSGSSWYDNSAGLPALPVNKLLYLHGVSNTQMFAATDAGVYKWLPLSGAWTCYNHGLPVCTVMDMEVNYCANKLRIATYGRGMWETPLDDVILAAETPFNVITGSTTWNTNMYLQSSVDIKAGGKLTIANCTIHMPKNAVISVEPGGKLDVTNSTITNDCENSWWQGIEARGQVLLSQTTTNQGWVVIEHNSVIQHARIGVSNCNATAPWSSDGGIIQCYDSKFLNNNVDVSFSTYDNFVSGVLHPNISHFTNCTFLVDNNYKGDAMGYAYRKSYMVWMKSVEGISYAGCSFINRNTHGSKLIGDGIHSVNSAFTVMNSCPTGSLCLTPYIRSRFCGLTHGIDVTGLWQPTLAATIDNADFDSCSIGVDVFKFNDVSTTRCNFNIGNGLGIDSVRANTFTGCNQNIGILIQNSQQYRVEANNFKGFPNGVPYWYNIGAAVTSPGTETESLYRNTFGSSLTVGAVGVGTSPGVGVSGVKVECNTFKSNTLDMLSTNNTTLGFYQGLAQYQSSLFVTAGNTFNSSTTNIQNDCAPTGMYYFYNTSVPAEYPGIVAGSGPVYRIGGISGLTVDKCTPGSFPGDIYQNGTKALDAQALALHKADFFLLSGVLKDTTVVHDSLIDFGNTQSLISTIDNSQSQQDLYSTLSSGSPFISQAALEEVAVKSALPYSDMMQLLKQNPDNLHDYGFYTAMKTAYNLSQADSDSIQVWSLNTTRRTFMEVFMDETQYSISNELNTIFGGLKSATDTNVSVNDSTGSGITTDSTSPYYMLDSNLVYHGLDSLDIWLVRKGGMNAQIERVGLYNWLGQTQLASQIFASIKPADQDESESYKTYASVLNIINGAARSGRNVYELNDQELASLNAMGSFGFTSNSGALTAYSLGSLSGIGVYPYPIRLDPCLTIAVATGPLGEVMQGIKDQKPSQPEHKTEFSVHPNPAAGIINFTYNVPDAGGDVDITVSSMNGETIFEKHTGNNTGNVTWDSSLTPPGVYLYTARSRNGIVSSGKIIVLKHN